MVTLIQQFPEHNLNEAITSHIRHEVIAIRTDQTIEQATQYFQKHTYDQQISYFYVVDQNNTLKGVVPARRLLMNPPSTRIESIMLDEVVSIAETSNVHSACALFYKYRYLAIPVVDHDGKLTGIIDVGSFTNSIIDVNRKRMHDDVFQLIGVHLASAQKRSPWKAFKFRFPWLLCNIVGGLMCAYVLSRYEVMLDHVLILALFIPVVLALSESVGMQSMTITLQRLHKDFVSLKYFLVAIRNEFITSFMLGIACGGLVAGVAWLWKGHLAMSLAIGYSIMLAIMTACLLGVVIPIAIRKIFHDPKVAAGPIILTVADILTLMLYLSISMQMLRNHG